MKQKRKRIGIIVIVVFFILMLVAGFLIGKPLLALAGKPEVFREWIQAKGILGKGLFIGMMALQVIIAVIPGEPLEIGAGYAFGVLEGTLLCMAGIVVGSLIIFLFVRRFGVKVMELFFSRKEIDSISFLKNPRKTNYLVFLLFFLPGTPKDLLSYAVGLTKIRLTTWLMITGIARIPSVLTSTAGGDALGVKSYGYAVLIFAVTAVVSCGGLLVYRKAVAKNS